MNNIITDNVLPMCYRDDFIANNNAIETTFLVTSIFQVFNAVKLTLSK